MIRKIKEKVVTAKNRMILKKYEITEERKLRKEEGSSEMVVVIFMVVIAIGLLILFRDQIRALITKVFTKSDTLVDSTF